MSEQAAGEAKAAGVAGGKRSYKDTLNLPKTPFAMKANLVQNEPASIKRWKKLGGTKETGDKEEMGLYAALRSARSARKDAKPFVFHDGPPYANGSIHLGHLMNKALKDFVVRTRSMAGKDCPFVPGWDCHGLPIEHKVMQQVVEQDEEARKQMRAVEAALPDVGIHLEPGSKGAMEKLVGLSDDQRKLKIREKCRKYAEKYQKLQASQMERLLTLADYENPYLTMQPRYEAAVLEVLADLVERGLVYRALKPVHWSVANETALAEAELEYEDREDLSVYVEFEAEDGEKVYGAFGLAEAEEDDEEEGDGAAGTEEETQGKGRGVRPAQRPTFMIWTTTPWTLPANLAIAVHPDVQYALVRVDGSVTVMASRLVEKVTAAAKSEDVEVLATVTGDKLVGLRYVHPFIERPTSWKPDAALVEGTKHVQEVVGWVGGPSPDSFRVVTAEYVTFEDGTGLVHTAPGHGTEDYQTGLRERLPIYSPVRGDGTYDGSVPEWLRGKSVWEANELVTDHLRLSGHLFYSHRFTHSYPHDWRSKTPVIFRCTEQWFVAVKKQFAVPKDPIYPFDRSLLERAFEYIDFEWGSRPQLDRAWVNLDGPALQAMLKAKQIRFVPHRGQNRMASMLESRPDWCISRQRAWGLPIPAFVTADDRALMTSAMVRAVAAVVREQGSDAWFKVGAAELLAAWDPASDRELAEGDRDLDKSRLHKGGDTLDVWLESGSSWNAVLRERGLGYPADLYLEGSDQHRGWFQSSLLCALGATGEPPYRALLTHGFMVAKDGRKLSKSKGDTVEDLFSDYGADVLRWWVCSLSYENDVKVDREFFDQAGESYRKVRNTLRFMLSNVSGCAEAEFDDVTFPPASPEAWVLGEFDALTEAVLAAYERYDFRAAHSAVYDFCNDTLSAVYLASVKDRLYCDAPSSERRRRTLAALWRMADGLCRLVAPVLCHTADEAWRVLRGAGTDEAESCVHLEMYLPPTGAQPDEAWRAAMSFRERAMKAMEDAKAPADRGGLGVENPLDLGLDVADPAGMLARLDATDLADLCGVSRVSVRAADGSAQEMAVTCVDLRGEPRCERSWKRDGTVTLRPDGGMLSDRDAAAVAEKTGQTM